MNQVMKTSPVKCRCGAVPEVTRPAAERNCWMVMCRRCRRNGPSVIDPAGREYAVKGWNLGLDHHFLLGSIGEEWHYFGGRPRYEYTEAEAGESKTPAPVPVALGEGLSDAEILDYAVNRGDPDLIWIAQLLAAREADRQS